MKRSRFSEKQILGVLKEQEKGMRCFFSFYLLSFMVKSSFCGIEWEGARCQSLLRMRRRI